MIIETIGIIIWIICGVISYGGTYAHLIHTRDICTWLQEDTSLDRLEYRFLALVSGVLGPISLFAGLLVGDFKYGLRYKYYRKTE